MLAAAPEVEVIEGGGGGDAMLRLTNRNIDVRFFPGGGLHWQARYRVGVGVGG